MTMSERMWSKQWLALVAIFLGLNVWAGDDAQATVRQICAAHDRVLPDPMASVMSKVVQLPPREPGPRDRQAS